MIDLLKNPSAANVISIASILIALLTLAIVIYFQFLQGPRLSASIVNIVLPRMHRGVADPLRLEMLLDDLLSETPSSKQACWVTSADLSRTRPYGAPGAGKRPFYDLQTLLVDRLRPDPFFKKDRYAGLPFFVLSLGLFQLVRFSPRTRCSCSPPVRCDRSPA